MEDKDNIIVGKNYLTTKLQDLTKYNIKRAAE